MTWLSIIPTIIKSIGDVILPATKTIAGDQAQRDAAASAENAAAREAYGKEFSYEATNRTTWDAIIDGVNRVPRPLMALGCVSLFVWCAYDPPSFSVAMTALQLVPAMLWNILMMVVAFYFTSRAIEKLTFGPYQVPASTRKLAVEEIRKAEMAEDEERDAEPLSFVGASMSGDAGVAGIDKSKSTLLRLAGYGPGRLHRRGYTGRLPISRSRGWRNPIASKYSAV